MDAVNDEPFAGKLVGNVGEPIRLKELNVAGVSAAPAKGGDGKDLDLSSGNA